jgi:hypothetical protein
LRWLSLYSLCMDWTESTTLNSPSIAAFVYSLQRERVYQPLPSNGRLFWLHNSGFERKCHNMKARLRMMMPTPVACKVEWREATCLHTWYCHLTQAWRESVSTCFSCWLLLGNLQKVFRVISSRQVLWIFEIEVVPRCGKAGLFPRCKRNGAYSDTRSWWVSLLQVLQSVRRQCTGYSEIVVKKKTLTSISSLREWLFRNTMLRVIS